MRPMNWQVAAAHDEVGGAAPLLDAQHWSSAKQGTFAKAARCTVAAETLRLAQEQGRCAVRTNTLCQHVLLVPSKLRFCEQRARGRFTSLRM